MNHAKELQRLIDNPPRLGQWLSDDTMEVYVRIGASHAIPRLKRLMSCVDLANLGVIPDEQNKGRFRAFLDQQSLPSEHPANGIEERRSHASSPLGEAPRQAANS